jgi:hypothetical protein
MKMEQTECYETLATKLHTPDNIPKETYKKHPNSKPPIRQFKYLRGICIDIAKREEQILSV